MSAKTIVATHGTEKKVKHFLPAKTHKVPNHILRMLAKEIETPFISKDWIYEIKWDGYRAL